MKNVAILTIILFSLLCAIRSFSQSQNLINKSFIADVPIYITYHKVGKSKKDTSFVFCLDQNNIFKIIDIDTATNNYIINVWPFAPDDISNIDTKREKQRHRVVQDRYDSMANSKKIISYDTFNLKPNLVRKLRKSHLKIDPAGNVICSSISTQVNDSGNAFDIYSDKIYSLIDSVSEKYVMVDARANYYDFLINANDFNNKCSQYYPSATSFVSGAITLPVKLRFGDPGGSRRFFNFEEKLNFGAAAGLQKQIKGRSQQSLNFLASFVLGTVSVDSASLRDPSYYNKNSPTATAFSLAGGCMYQYKTFQIGTFIGADWIPSVLGTKWKYQGQPWLGLGLGISLFTPNSLTNSNSSANSNSTNSN